MLYEQKLTGSVIMWPGGKPKDGPAPPAQPEIVAMLAARECIVKMGFNCYEIVNKRGDALEFPYNGTLIEWHNAIEQVAGYCEGTDLHAPTDHR